MVVMEGGAMVPRGSEMARRWAAAPNASLYSYRVELDDARRMSRMAEAWRRCCGRRMAMVDVLCNNTMYYVVLADVSDVGMTIISNNEHDGG
jgi:hypothetical protein